MNTPIHTVRLPKEMIDYFESKGLKLRTILEDVYYEMKQNELPELLNEIAKLEQSVLQKRESVLHLEEQKLKKEGKHVDQVKGIVMHAFKPEFYIGKEVNGVKITKKQIQEWKEDVSK